MSYVALNNSTVIDYLRDLPSLDGILSPGADLHAREVGDGNLNLVFIVENRASARVFVPGVKTAALVHCDTSWVASNTPKAPAPLACGLRSGMFSRLKWASVSTRWWSWSSSGPSGPTDKDCRSLTAGEPLSWWDPLSSAPEVNGGWSAMGISPS